MSYICGTAWGKLLRIIAMTYSCVTGKKDQWSAGSAVSEMTTKCPSTYGLLCQGCRRWTQLSAPGVYHW